MPRNSRILSILSKHYMPYTMVDTTYKGFDLTFKTDKDGNPVLMFIGKRKEDGSIAGSRFLRSLIRNKNGTVIKDHWALKGEAS